MYINIRICYELGIDLLATNSVLLVLVGLGSTPRPRIAHQPQTASRILYYRIEEPIHPGAPTYYILFSIFVRDTRNGQTDCTD